MVHNLKTWILGIAILAALSGCNDRVTQVAREAANRQAQQNTVMAEPSSGGGRRCTRISGGGCQSSW